MSTLGALFQRGGQTYRTVPDLIDRLPKGLQHRATVAWKAIMRRLARGELDERATTRAMAEESGWSESLIQSGLHALDVVLRDMGLTPLIERIRAHGRRTIVPAPLAARGTAGPAADGPPPGPPPEEREDTTTDAASTSSPQSTPEPPEMAGDYPPAELIDRACKLIPKATRGRVIDAAAVYGSEWVSRALDVVETRNRKPGNKRVESWGFVLSTLANWRKEGGPPPEVPPASPATATPATRRADEEPPRPLTAIELADLVEVCKSPVPRVARFSREQLRKAVADGAIPAELVATIPAELLEPDPRAP